MREISFYILYHLEFCSFVLYMYTYNVKGACASVHDDILQSLLHSVISPSSGECRLTLRLLIS